MKTKTGERARLFCRRYRTPDKFDDLILYGDADGFLAGLLFEGSRDAQRYAVISAAGVEGEAPVFADTRRWLDAYFGGDTPTFTPPIRMRGLTPFRRAVSDAMRAIPSGTTVSYGALAATLARPRNDASARISARAVGGAVGWNPVCIIIPCHRVIGANGSLTGYGGGLHNKIALLAHEGVDLSHFSLPSKGTAL